MRLGQFLLRMRQFGIGDHISASAQKALICKVTAYMLSANMVEIVLDTSVFVSALRSEGGASREVVRRCLRGRYRPLFGNALWLEYEDVLGRDVWTDATTPAERQRVLAALVQAGRWVSVYYGWRPNLPDEGDNHLIELAVAGNAAAIVTHNVRDVARGELIWKSLRVLTPAQCLEEFL
jgi:predicted nucleic acid-binding protein